MAMRRRLTQRCSNTQQLTRHAALPQANGRDSAHSFGTDTGPQEDPKFALRVVDTMLDHIAVHLERCFQQLESIAGPGLPALRLKVRRSQRRPMPVCEAAASHWTILPLASVHRCVFVYGQVSKTRLEWLRRLRMNIAALLATVTSVKHIFTSPWYAPLHADKLYRRK